MGTILLTAGCGAPPDGSSNDVAGRNDPDSTAAQPDILARSPSSTETPNSGDREPCESESNVTVYRTRDVAVWPKLDPPPMVIEFDLPEIPERIKGPFTEKDLLPIE
jgi:hypothetical protein